MLLDGDTITYKHLNNGNPLGHLLTKTPTRLLQPSPSSKSPTPLLCLPEQANPRRPTQRPIDTPTHTTTRQWFTTTKGSGTVRSPGAPNVEELEADLLILGDSNIRTLRWVLKKHHATVGAPGLTIPQLTHSCPKNSNIKNVAVLIGQNDKYTTQTFQKTKESLGQLLNKLSLNFPKASIIGTEVGVRKEDNTWIRTNTSNISKAIKDTFPNFIELQDFSFTDKKHYSSDSVHHLYNKLCDWCLHRGEGIQAGPSSQRTSESNSPSTESSDSLIASFATAKDDLDESLLDIKLDEDIILNETLD